MNVMDLRIGKNPDMYLDRLGSIISEMTQSYTWLQLCTQQLDVTIVGDEYSFLDYLRKSPDMDEF